ncbi:hypothetical protein WMF11_46020 [Sorangium sp. So ce295]|uniref:hypothetical protein n=1 Tax=unclassified Sorangium TaxID=2621164 RepID=UPI003F605B9F
MKHDTHRYLPRLTAASVAVSSVMAVPPASVSADEPVHVSSAAAGRIADMADAPTSELPSWLTPGECAFGECAKPAGKLTSDRQESAFDGSFAALLARLEKS